MDSLANNECPSSLMISVTCDPEAGDKWGVRKRFLRPTNEIIVE